MNDFDMLSEQGQLSASERHYCHNISITDDDLVEPLETLLVQILPEYNVADVQLSPQTTTINILDNDGMEQPALLLTTEVMFVLPCFFSLFSSPFFLLKLSVSVLRWHSTQ